MIYLHSGCRPHEQDKMYGKFVRVVNVKKDISKGRCTVCGAEVTFRQSEITIPATPKKD